MYAPARRTSWLTISGNTKKIAYALPNGFDEAVHRTSRLAVRRRRREPETALIRIGYASGTRTHQRDFGQASDALARVLREHPECRLVLFRDPLSQEPVGASDRISGFGGLHAPDRMA